MLNQSFAPQFVHREHRGYENCDPGDVENLFTGHGDGEASALPRSSSIRSSHSHHFDSFVTSLCVSMPPAVGLLTKGGHEICNVHSDLSACCAREGETDIDHSAQPQVLDSE